MWLELNHIYINDILIYKSIKEISSESPGNQEAEKQPLSKPSVAFTSRRKDLYLLKELIFTVIILIN